MKRIDLHTHTTASDGKNSPSENVLLAVQKGLAAVAITDHDTVAGVQEALKTAEQYELEVIPGIEISTLSAGQDIHILGYYLDYEHPQLWESLEKLRDTRNLRNEMLIERLNKLGIDITMQEVAAKQITKGGNIGRPHIADVLMEKGIVASLQEAFEIYLGKEGKAYVNPPRIAPEEAIKIITQYNGIPVLAHPGLYDQDHLIEDLVKAGLRGIEVYHPDHSTEDVKRYQDYAQQYQLITTGGSDYHGVRNGEVFHGEMGSQEVREDTLEALKKLQIE